ncbi:MAG: hypothetical protein ACJ705_06700 [Nitrososphaeraceae archaeon]
MTAFLSNSITTITNRTGCLVTYACTFTYHLVYAIFSVISTCVIFHSSHDDGGTDAMENMFYSIEFRIKEEIGKDAKPYRS